MSERKIPYDMDAEQAVLGCMLMDREAAALGTDLLREEDFYSVQNKTLFQAMTDLTKEEIPLDVVTVKDRLNDRHALARAGGLSHLTDTALSVGSSVNLKRYAGIVLEQSRRREWIKRAEKLREAAVNGSYEALLNELEALQNVREERTVDGLTPVNQVIGDILKKTIAQVKAGKPQCVGLRTGFSDLDAYTGGFQNNNLVILAARPSMGKTAFALDLIRGAAKRLQSGGLGRNIAFFSLEMSREQITKRVCSAELNIPNDKFKLLDFDSRDIEKMLAGIERIERDCAKIYIDDTPAVSVREINAKCHDLKTKSGLDMGLIVVDYIQLMTGNKSGNREQEISGISRELKTMAKKYRCPALVLSQLSRACEQRVNKRPLLSDLRESGAIEQDADVVMFLYRDEYYYPNTENKGVAELILAKHRDGAVGTVELAFSDTMTTFRNKERGR